MLCRAPQLMSLFLLPLPPKRDPGLAGLGTEASGAAACAEQLWAEGRALHALLLSVCSNKKNSLRLAPVCPQRLPDLC